MDQQQEAPKPSIREIIEEAVDAIEKTHGQRVHMVSIFRTGSADGHIRRIEVQADCL